MSILQKKKRQIKLKDRFGIYLLFASFSNLVVFDSIQKESGIQTREDLRYLMSELANKLRLFYTSKIKDEYDCDIKKANKQLNGYDKEEPLSFAVSMLIYYLEELKTPIYLTNEFRKRLYAIDTEIWDKYKTELIIQTQKGALAQINALKSHMQGAYDATI